MSLSATGAKHLQITLPAASLLFWQSLICVLILLPQTQGPWYKQAPSVWGLHGLRSIAGFGAFLCFYLALDNIPLVEATLLRACAPLCVPLIVLLVHKTAIPKSRWLPLIFGFLGAAAVIQPTPTSIKPWHLVGLMSALGLAFSMVTTRMLSKHISGTENMLVYFGISALLALILSLAQGHSLAVPITHWPLVAGISLTLYVGMYLYTLAYTLAPASVVSPVSYIGIVFSGLWGWMIWRDFPDAFVFLGTVLILISISLSLRTSQNAKRVDPIE